MIWIIINILFLAAGIILITASDYCNKFKHDDILEALMCIGGIVCIIIFVLSEGARRYPFG